MLFKLLFISLLSVGLVSSSYENEFKSYVEKYDKHYNQNEYIKRYNIFSDNMLSLFIIVPFRLSERPSDWDFTGCLIFNSFSKALHKILSISVDIIIIVLISLIYILFQIYIQIWVQINSKDQ